MLDAPAGSDPYHEMCRRCSSCMQVVSSEDSVLLVGRLLCKQCDQLFGKFFLPNRRGEAARMKEIFNAWDADGSGMIDKGEMRRVLKASGWASAWEGPFVEWIHGLGRQSSHMSCLTLECEWGQRQKKLYIYFIS